MTIQTNAIQYNPFDLPGSYSLDRWNNYDFSHIVNYTLKEEVKYFVYTNYLKNGKEKTFIKYNHDFKWLILFLNNFSLTSDKPINSILDEKLDKLVERYKNYLSENGLNTRKTYNKLMANMTVKVYNKNALKINLLKRFYSSILFYFHSLNIPMYKRDKWDLKEIPFHVNLETTTTRSFNFNHIMQEQIKHITKRFIYNRLQYKTVGTCKQYLGSIRQFSLFLRESYPEIHSLENVNYDIIESYYIYLATECNITKNTKNERIRDLRLFLNLSLLMNWKGCLKEQIIFDFDLNDENNLKPRYLTDDELQNLNRHIEELPIVIARMLFVIQNVGMRISELCLLTPDCLRRDSNSNCYIKYYQYKTKKINKVPVAQEVYDTIQVSIEENIKQYGQCTYVFTNVNNAEKMTPDVFNQYLNNLCYKYKILDKNDDILHIQSHAFRGSVATKYINLGVDIQTIRKLLGQSSSGAIYHYIEGNEADMINMYDPIMEMRSEMIMNIGNIDFSAKQIIEDEEVLPLGNGYCSKKISTGICDKANSCYECSMFVASPEYINIYISHLYRVRDTIRIARINNFERQLQVNQRLERSILSVIKKVNPNFEME